MARRSLVVFVQMALPLLVTICAISPARATFIVNIAQQGADVFASGSGTFDTQDLTESCSSCSSNSSLVQGSYAIVSTGSGSASDFYGDISGPLAIGTGAATLASTWAGLSTSILSSHIVSASPTPYLLNLPSNYISGTFVSNSATFDNTTIAALELTDGTYAWTWGSGADADSFVVNIGAPSADVPEPASILMFVPATLLALGFASRRHQRAA